MGQKSVAELESILEIRQPALYQDLTVLRTERLMQTRREGKKIYYSLSSKIAASVMILLYKHFCVK
jgi:DNA-binding transcriptional ArsR family regulator